MAVNNFDYQFGYPQKGPIDYALTPLQDISDLKSISKNYRYDGMTVVVTNSNNNIGTPIEFWLVNGITNGCWKIKSLPRVPSYQKLLDITTIGSEAKMSGLFEVGSEAIVLKDESIPNSPMSKYWVVEIKEDGTVVWERKRYGNELVSKIDEIIEMLNGKKYGNVVYVVPDGGTIYLYKYTDTGIKEWGEEVPEGAEKLEEYGEGLYAITKEDDDVKFERILTDEDGISISGTDIEK